MSDQIEEQEEELEVEQEAEPTPEEIEALEAAEQEAAKYGWRPKSEFDLDPNNWLDAEKFLTLPSTEMKRLRDESKVKEAEFEERLQRLDATSKQAIEAAQKLEAERYREQLSRITASQREAVEGADVEQWEALEEQRVKLAPPNPVQTPTQDADVTKYQQENEWTKDQVMVNVAIQAIEAAPGMKAAPFEQQMEFVERQLKSYFPHKFETKEAPKAPTRSKVDGGGLGAIGRGGKSAASLPPEAQAAGKEYVEAGYFKDMDAYAKSYFEQEA